MDCEVIQDLMPLVAEKMASEKSCQLVEEHLITCEACAKQMYRMQMPQPISTECKQERVDGMQGVRRQYRRSLASMIALIVYATIIIVIWVDGKVFLKPHETMGYSILYYYLVLPLASSLCSLLVGKSAMKVKYALPFIHALIGFLMPFTISNSSDILFAFCNLIPSAIGLGIGLLIRRGRSKKA